LSTPDWRALLDRAADHAVAYLDTVEGRPVGPPVDPADLRRQLGGPLPERGLDPETVLDELVAGADAGLVASVGPRYFGYVVGGVVPAALAAEWMAAAWDQMAGSYAGSPAAAVVEEVTVTWLLELLELPAQAAGGLTTGSQMATFTALSAARRRLLAGLGWDVECDGLRGAPAIPIVTGIERHVTVDVALRYLGIGSSEMVLVECDAQGAIEAESLAAALAGLDGPAIVVAQAGNVNTGAFDPFGPIADACGEAGAWLHVDGAFGLWARLDPERRHLLDGVERADSWGTDGHKWLNVPYDTGMIFVRDAEAHREAMRKSASYAMSGGEGERDSELFVPEFSRRARAFAVYAALRSLGREGVAAMVARDNALARRFAGAVAEHPAIEVLNEVAINQVLLRFGTPGESRERAEALLDAVVAAVHRDGTFWAGRTTWREQPGMRVSICGWNTTEADVDRAATVLAALVESASDQT
jgi:glutamate/tyrosine decarboxylase-like PLP-dependent enzyme